MYSTFFRQILGIQFALVEIYIVATLSCLLAFYHEMMFMLIVGFSVVASAALLAMSILCEFGEQFQNLSTSFKLKCIKNTAKNIWIKKKVKSFRPLKCCAGDYMVCNRNAWLRIVSDVVIDKVISLLVLYRYN